VRLVVPYSTEESILSERLLIGLLYRSFICTSCNSASDDVNGASPCIAYTDTRYSKLLHGDQDVVFRRLECTAII
jgi:hypothetical protein